MERNALQFAINKFNIPQYLPPEQKESNIYLEVQAVILEKKSKFELDINRMYVALLLYNAITINFIKLIN